MDVSRASAVLRVARDEKCEHHVAQWRQRRLIGGIRLWGGRLAAEAARVDLILRESLAFAYDGAVPRLGPGSVSPWPLPLGDSSPTPRHTRLGAWPTGLWPFPRAHALGLVFQVLHTHNMLLVGALLSCCIVQ
jgi:hypothetical protein